MPRKPPRKPRTIETLEEHRAMLRFWKQQLVKVAKQRLERALDREVEALMQKPYGKRETFYSDVHCRAELQDAGERLLRKADEWFDYP